MALKTEEITKQIMQFAHSKIQNPSEYLEKAVAWMFDKQNKYTVFSNFEHVLTYGVQNIDEFKEKVGVVFAHAQYMGMPSSITKKLKNDEVDVIQEIVENHLVNHYKSDITKFITAFNRIDAATKELQDAQKELESFVSPRKNKMR